MAKHPFPKIPDINPEFWCGSRREPCELKRDCYEAIMRIDGPTWDRLAANDRQISDDIFAKLKDDAKSSHGGASWMCLVASYRDLARTGFPDRFLLKNQHLWVMGYYMPDYLAEAMFIAGAGVIAALSL